MRQRSIKHLCALFLATGLTVGCVGVPARERVVAGFNVAARLDRLAVGKSTRSDVTELLGDAPYRSADCRVVAYPYLIEDSVWYSPSGTDRPRSSRAAVMTFDSADVLADLRIVRGNSSMPFGPWSKDGGPHIGDSAVPHALLPSDDTRRRDIEWQWLYGDVQ